METATKKPSFKIQVETEVPMERIVSNLCSAFEGGSNYWYDIKGYVKPENFDNSEPDYIQHKYLSYPVNKGGMVKIEVLEGVDSDMEGKTFFLDLATIQTGLTAMAKNHNRHFTDMMTEDDDSTTGDVLLQCCLFGNVLYG